jgi:hypothetical protein
MEEECPNQFMTESDLDAITDSIQYHHFPDTTATVCCIKTVYGATVLGDSSCYRYDVFDAELGRKYAYQEAREQLRKYAGFHEVASAYEAERSNK